MVYSFEHDDQETITTDGSMQNLGRVRFGTTKDTNRYVSHPLLSIYPPFADDCFMGGVDELIYCYPIGDNSAIIDMRYISNRAHLIFLT